MPICPMRAPTLIRRLSSEIIRQLALTRSEGADLNILEVVEDSTCSQGWVLDHSLALLVDLDGKSLARVLLGNQRADV